MDINKPIYFCNHCKKIETDLDNLLFVEEKGNRGFCSEACIENFFEKIVEHYEGEEKKWREKYNLQSEDVLQVVGKPSYMEKILSDPSEIWSIENELEEKLYSYIRHFDDPRWGEFSMGILCFVYQSKPSFILMATATRQDLLIDKLRIGNKEEDIKSLSNQPNNDSKGSTIQIDEETLMSLENKKSVYLAQMLGERSPADIPFEQFHLYDTFMAETMKGPDEIFSFKDDESDTILTYIKAHEKEGISFYFFVLCLKYDIGKSDEEAMIPILAFPTVDGEIYKIYRKGDLVSGSLKN